MVAVRFLLGTSLYNPGEIAGFDRITASKLVKDGIAVYLDPKPAGPAKSTGGSKGTKKKKTKELRAGGAKKKYVTKA